MTHCSTGRINFVRNDFVVLEGLMLVVKGLSSRGVGTYCSSVKYDFVVLKDLILAVKGIVLGRLIDVLLHRLLPREEGLCEEERCCSIKG